MIKLLITGAKGQLGNEIRDLAPKFKHFQFTFTDVDDLDITNPQMLKEFVATDDYNFIINCAAYTAVDKAESEVELATEINENAVRNIAEIAAEKKIKIITISTDYVFGGVNCRPYKEDEPTDPNSVYGTTKLHGEQAVIQSDADAIILRTSWLYSTYGKNFVKTIMQIAKERDSLNVVFDQIGSPTYAADLAMAILEIAGQIVGDSYTKQTRIYNYSNEGVCSWYDFAIAILEMVKINCRVNPVETKEFPTPATRPYYSVLDKTKIKNEFGITIPYWKDSLRKCINRLIKS